MGVKGFWFEAYSSTRSNATISVSGDACTLAIEGGESRHDLLSDLTISDRLGDMPRRLTWPDGATFETRDNAAIDALLAENGHKGYGSVWLHKLESSWGWVAMSVIVTVLVGYLGIRYGLPAAAESIARKLPASVNETASRQALATMDQLMFEPSELGEQERAMVQQQFDDLLAALPPGDITYQLHFRSMNGVSNAMALPGGDVVVTDAFVELVEHPQELDSVLLHEIGHVVEYHGMTQVIRASAMSVIVALAFGDLSVIGDIAVGIPVFVMQNSYSQDAETEADEYAFARMQQMGKDPKYFASIILRLSEEDLEEVSEELKTSYFSSHPDTQIRARKALEASQAMNPKDE